MLHTLEAFAEQSTRTAQARGSGADRNAFGLCDLSNLELLDLSQHQHAPQIFGQRAQQLVQQRARFTEVRSVLGLGGEVDDFVRERLCFFTPPPQLATQIGSDAQGDPVEVRALAALRNAFALLSRRHEYLLSSVICVFGREAHPPQQTPNEIEVLAHERAQLSLPLATERLFGEACRVDGQGRNSAAR